MTDALDAADPRSAAADTDPLHAGLPSDPEPAGDAGGTAPPYPGVPEPLAGALAARGFEALTSVQRAVLDAVEAGADLRISSQTGSGKTVGIGLAMASDVLADASDFAHRGREYAGPVALVIVPTRELAAQVSDELTWLFAGVRGTSVDVVTGGTPLGPERRRLSRDPRILVGTPGRLVDHLESGALALGGVRQLVLDEADQMLDMGFRDELEAILERTPAERHTHLVSATFPDAILRLADRYQRAPRHVEGTRLGVANADIEHVGYLVRPHERYDLLVNLLLLADGARTLVFVNKRTETAELSAKLTEDGFDALPLSGELQQAQRTRTLAAFRTGRASVLVATDVAARGLDVPDVAIVIHTAVPIDAEAYTHRSGRTGRAGQRGRSILMAAPSRERRVVRLLEEAGVSLRFEPVPRMRDVQRVIDERRRKELVALLDDAGAEPPSETLELARELLEGRDATRVVASLAARALPKERTHAREVAGAFPARGARGKPTRSPERSDSPAEDRPSMGREAFLRGEDRRAPRRPAAPNRAGAAAPRGEMPPSRAGMPQFQAGMPPSQVGTPPSRAGAAPSAPSRHRQADSYVRFTVNWGFKGGANPRRLLAVVCRRGHVTSREIGAIDIGPVHSTFEVAAHAAESFAERAQRDDPRDPGLWIAVDRGRRHARR